MIKIKTARVETITPAIKSENESTLALELEEKKNLPVSTALLEVKENKGQLVSIKAPEKKFVVEYLKRSEIKDTQTLKDNAVFHSQTTGSLTHVGQVEIKDRTESVIMKTSSQFAKVQNHVYTLLYLSKEKEQCPYVNKPYLL